MIHGEQMSISTKNDLKQIICNTISAKITPEQMEDDFRLAGENLDSMAVTNLILAIEDYFGFVFDDEELSAEAFETVATLNDLITQKLDLSNA